MAAPDFRVALDNLDPDGALTAGDLAVALAVTDQSPAQGEALDRIARLRAKLKAALKRGDAAVFVPCASVVALGAEDARASVEADGAAALTLATESETPTGAAE